MAKLPKNCCKLITLSVGFLLLFSSFITAQNLAAVVLKELGFGNLGFYSLGILYCAFAFSCFIATPIVNKCGERLAMVLGALCYWPYITSFLLPSASIKYPDSMDVDKTLIEAVILISAALNGFGASILWVAKGRYISRIACEENKGTFNSIFWAVYMMCIIVGALFGAVLLEHTDAFTFYCAMSAFCILAALFFLFLRPAEKNVQLAEPQEHQNKNEDELPTTSVENEDLKHEKCKDQKLPSKSVKQDIHETCKLVANSRMAMLYPILVSSSINIGIFSSVFVKIMTDTMEQEDEIEDDSTEQKSKALFCMLGLGVGEIVGSLVIGRILDKCSLKCTILLQCVAVALAYGLLIIYAVQYEFTWLGALAMTTSFGVQDAGTQCILQSMLGFQFESQTTPFSVYKFVQSLLIFAVFCLESAIDTQESYIIYFSVCVIIAISAWAVFLKCFKVLPKETIAEMRRESSPQSSRQQQESPKQDLEEKGELSQKRNQAPINEIVLVN